MSVSHQKLRSHDIFRLVLARKIFREAINLCQTRNDPYGFSHGLIGAHDALDNFAGAILSKLNIVLPPHKNNLVGALKEIEAREKKSDVNFSLVGKSEIGHLNQIRNNIKHSGIMPNIAQASSLIVPIRDFFREYSSRYFGLEWESISLADLIKDDAVRNEVKSIETLIAQSDYKNALEAMAIVKFKVFDELSLQITLDSKYDVFGSLTEEKKKLRASTNIFPDQDKHWFSELYDRTDFLEKGISRDLMRRFEELTAKVGVNNPKDWKYILSHGHNWAQANWTKQNALFCYDFLVDSILKNQLGDHDFNEEFVWTIYTIRAQGDVSVYDKDDNLLYTMGKGEERDALMQGRVDGEWELYGDGDIFIRLEGTDEKEDVIGFMKQDDKDKIEFLETRQYIRGEDKKLVLSRQQTGG